LNRFHSKGILNPNSKTWLFFMGNIPYFLEWNCCWFLHQSNLSCVFATVGTGISHLQFANMNMTRNLFVVGFSIFMGLSVPQYFSEFTVRSDHGPINTQQRWVIFSLYILPQMFSCFISLVRPLWSRAMK
jgi:hypothetical protein